MGEVYAATMTAAQHLEFQIESHVTNARILSGKHPAKCLIERGGAIFENGRFFVTEQAALNKLVQLITKRRIVLPSRFFEVGYPL